MIPPPDYTNYRPLLMPFGDSTTKGVGAAIEAAWRQASFFRSQDLGSPFYFLGSQNDPGGGDGLAINPRNEGIAGITSEDLLTLLFRIAADAASPPDIPQWVAGVNSLDPTNGNESPATVLATTSTALDLMWGFRWCEHYQIVVGEIFPTLTTWNAKVVAFNAGLGDVVASKPYRDHVTIWRSSKALPADPALYHDPIHPNDAGYRLLGLDHALTVSPVVRRARGN